MQRIVTQIHTIKAWENEGKSINIAADNNNSLPGLNTQFTADKADSDSVMTTAASEGTALCSNCIVISLAKHILLQDIKL